MLRRSNLQMTENGCYQLMTKDLLRWIFGFEIMILNKFFINKIWDLPGGLLIDFMRLSRPCVGLSFSEAGDYLATCHQGERGVFLWANKQLFLAGIPKSNVAKELRVINFFFSITISTILV